MRHMRYFFAASVLASAISLSAFAGDMHTGIAPPQPTPTPAQASGVMSTPVAGDIHTTNSEEVAAEVVAEAVLSLVQGALSLL